MAIKKVVDKPKTVKKFPEFDSSKIYVVEYKNIKDDLCRINVFKGEFIVTWIGRTKNTAYRSASFEGIIKRAVDNIGSNINSIYILNNQQELARFIMGCREFPKLEEIEVGEELAEDEVSVEDSDVNKIYALKGVAGSLYKAHSLSFRDESFAFISIDCSRYWANGVHLGLRKLLKSNIGQKIYQFDTQEEFLRWSLEQVTGKKFKVCDAYQGQLEASEYKLISFVNKPIEVLS